MECRKDAGSSLQRIKNSATCLLSSSLSFFSATRATFCTYDQVTYFESPSGIPFRVSRGCDDGSLAGDNYFDSAVGNLGSRCSANLNTEDVGSYSDIASWLDGGIAFSRGDQDMESNANTTSFENCVTGLLNDAKDQLYQHRREADFWLGVVAISLAVISGTILLACFGGCIYQGYIQKPKERKKPTVLKQEEEMKQVEEVIVEPSSESSTTSITCSRDEETTSITCEREDGEEKSKPTI